MRIFLALLNSCPSCAERNFTWWLPPWCEGWFPVLTAFFWLLSVSRMWEFKFKQLAKKICSVRRRYDEHVKYRVCHHQSLTQAHSKTRDTGGRRMRKAKRRHPSHGAPCLPWCCGASRKVGSPSGASLLCPSWSYSMSKLLTHKVGRMVLCHLPTAVWGYINLDALERMHLKPVICFGLHLTIFIHVHSEWLMDPFFSFFFSWGQWKYPVLCQLCFITLQLTHATFGIP